MTKELTFRDRFSLLFGLLPQYGNITEMQAAKAIKERIGFSAEEKLKADIKELNGRLVYNPAAVISLAPIKVEFSELELNVISGNIERMDKQGRVQIELLETIEKFISHG